MSEFTLTRMAIKAGSYQGVLTTRARIRSLPKLELRFLDAALGPVTVTPDPKAKKTWQVNATVPISTINEGVQTYIIYEAKSGDTLDSFAIITGTPLHEDLRAEMVLLRAELDMLKQAFRNHCVESEK